MKGYSSASSGGYQSVAGASSGPTYSPSQSFYSQNGNSGLYVGSAPKQPESQSVGRPYADVGKVQVNLYGRRLSPDPTAETKKNPLDSMPWDFGDIVGIGQPLRALTDVIGTGIKGVVDTASNIPATAIPFVGLGVGLQQMQARSVWDANATDPDRVEWEKQVKSGLIEAGTAQAEYYRQLLKRQGVSPLLTPFMVPPQTLGDVAIEALQALSLPQAAITRTFAGTQARLDSLKAATNEDLNNNRTLLDIRDRLIRGEITDSAAADELWLAGFPLTNPLKGATGFVGSAALEVLSDPTTLLSLGTATAAKMSASAGEKMLEQLVIKAGDRLGEQAGKDLMARVMETTAQRGARTGVNEGYNALQTMLATGDATQVAIAEDALKSVGTATGLLMRSDHVIRAANWVNHALDPFTLFGADPAAKRSQAFVAREVSTGMQEAHNLITVSKAQAIAREMGVGDAVAEFEGRAGAQYAAKVGAQAKARQILKTGAQADLNDIPADIGRNYLRRFGSDVRQVIKSEVERTRYRVLALKPGGAEQAMTDALTRARAQVSEMFGFGDAQAEEFVRRVGGDENAVSYIDQLHYGFMTREFLKARAAAGPEFAGLTFLGPRQLTREGIKELRSAVRSGNMTSIRALIQRYDDLYENVALDATDDEVLSHVKSLLNPGKGKKGLAEWVPNEVTDLSKLPASMQDYVKRFGEGGYRLAYQPEEAWRPILDAKNRLVGLKPWTDVVDDVGAQRAVGRWTARMNQMLTPVTYATIERKSLHRFTADVANRWGLPSGQAESLFYAIRDEAERQRTTVRGLTTHDMYRAVQNVKIPPSMRRNLTERNIAEAVLRAYEGEAAMVGLTQKFTGRIKTWGAGMGNHLGVLAERAYPLVRFTLNPVFQLQEMLEMPLILLARGELPQGAERVGAIASGLGRAVAKRDMGELADMLGRTVGRRRLINEQTAFVRKVLLNNGENYAADMAEYSAYALAGWRAGDNIAHGSLGRIKAWAADTFSPHRIKTRAELQMYRSNYGKMYASALKEQAPEAYGLLADWAYRRGMMRKSGGVIVDDGMVAMDMLQEKLLRAMDPESAFAEFGPDMFRGAMLGRQARVSTRLVADIAGSTTGTDMTWSEVRRAVRGGDTTLLGNIENELHRRGADPDYIRRSLDGLTGPTANEFYKGITALGRSADEVAGIRSFHEALARAQGISLDEFISRRFVGAPTVGDPADFTGRTYFQRLRESLEARGKSVPEPNGPEAQAMLDYWEGTRPVYTVPTEAEMKAQGMSVKDLTDAQTKARRWQTARATRAKDPSKGAPPDVLDTNGQPIRFINHRVGNMTFQQWWDQVRAVIPDDRVLYDLTDWYPDMRTAMLAIYDKNPEEASRALLAFALTQRATSPADGMRYTALVNEYARRGEALPIDRKFAALSTNELRDLYEKQFVSSVGTGQKLTDFIDSLFGTKTRSAGVAGPTPGKPWGPAAIDVWARRDLGFLDQKMDEVRWRAVTGAQTVVRRKNGDVHLVYADGFEQTVPASAIGREVPNDLEYDYGVEFYNGAADFLNANAALDKTDWTAADAQAIGWFRAKRSMGDMSGDPLEATSKNQWHVAFETVPAPGVEYATIYPLGDDLGDYLDEPTLTAVTTDISRTTLPIASEIAGTPIVSRHVGSGAWLNDAGELMTSPNVVAEVLASPDGAERFARSLLDLHQQTEVRAFQPVTGVSLVPKTDNNIRFMVHYDLPADMPEDEVWDAIAAIRGEEGFVRSNGSSVIRTPDGGWRLMSAWDPQGEVKWWDPKVFDGATGDLPVVEFTRADGSTLLLEGRQGRTRQIVVRSDDAGKGGTAAERLAGAAGAGVQSRYVARRSEDWSRAAYEHAFRTHAHEPLARYRANRAIADDGFAQRVEDLPELGDLSRPAYFQRGPKGWLGATIIDAESHRTAIVLNRGRTRADTLIHELGHDFGANLDPSGRALYLKTYNDRVRARRGLPPRPSHTAQFKRQSSTTWNADVHEAFANDFVEYLRTGSAPEAELEPLFQFYGKTLRAHADRLPVSPEVKGIFDTMLGDASKFRGGIHYDPSEQMLLDVAFARSRQAERLTRDVVHFKGARTPLERSINHPFFGLYPSSYMWGKVLPELVEFLAFRPFGLKVVPGAPLELTNRIYQSAMLQQEHDPEARKFLSANEPFLRSMAMLVPALPWDMPVNAPIWQRRLVEALAEAHDANLDPKRKNVGLGDVISQYSTRTLPDVLGYNFGPSAGVGSIAKMGIGGFNIAADAVGATGIPTAVGEALDSKPNFFRDPTPSTAVTPARQQVASPLVQTPPQVQARDLNSAVMRGQQTLEAGLQQVQVDDQLAQELGIEQP